MFIPYWTCIRDLSESLLTRRDSSEKPVSEVTLEVCLFCKTLRMIKRLQDCHYILQSRPFVEDTLTLGKCQLFGLRTLRYYYYDRILVTCWIFLYVTYQRIQW